MSGSGAGLGRAVLGRRPAARGRGVGVSAVSRDGVAGSANTGRTDVRAESLSCFAHAGAQGHGDLGSGRPSGRFNASAGVVRSSAESSGSGRRTTKDPILVSV